MIAHRMLPPPAAPALGPDAGIVSPLDRLLPAARRIEVDGIDLALPIERVWEIVRHGDLGQSPAIHALFALRTLPGRLAGAAPEPLRLRLDDLVSSPEKPGFQVLFDDPPHEVAVGAIGQVWHLDIPFRHVSDAAAFAAFAEPDFVKVAWALRLTGRGESETHLAIEVRVDATDDAAWKKFRRYFRFIGPGSHFIRRSLLHALARAYPVGRAARRDGWRDVLEGLGGAAVMAAAFATPFLRRARGHWGLDPAVAARPYPGDELIPAPRWSWTHGLEIAAPAEETWPWVAQIGADRAGFYSYQWLENLVGCNVRNAAEVHPEWAAREGDGVRLHPKMPPLPIVAIEPGRSLLAFASADPAARAAGKPWVETTWLFQVEPLGPGRCRFISRYRLGCSDDAATRLQFGPALLEPIGFAMDRRMLLGVRERAEGWDPRI